MLDREEIESLIDELQNEDLVVSTCGDLANLYIILDHLPFENTKPSEDLQALLCDYMVTRDFVHLNIFLKKASEILSEVYHTIDTNEERQEFQEFVDRVNSIITPTII